jgi:hypothetical protein
MVIDWTAPLHDPMTIAFGVVLALCGLVLIVAGVVSTCQWIARMRRIVIVARDVERTTRIVQQVQRDAERELAVVLARTRHHPGGSS